MKTEKSTNIIALLLTVTMLIVGLSACGGARSTLQPDSSGPDHGNDDNNNGNETPVPVLTETPEDNHVFQATITEIGDGAMLVSPTEGSPEAACGKSIRVVIQNMPGSPEPVVGDVVEITYNGFMTEEDPPSPCGMESITVIRHGDSGFSITYELGVEFTDIFTDTPEKADAGDTVELRTAILYDPDLHVYVDGQEIGKAHYDSDYWGYSFLMPERNVLVTAKFYTKDEVWGTTTVEQNALRGKRLITARLVDSTKI